MAIDGDENETVTYGKQSSANDCQASATTRCDTRYFTHNTLEIFFRTGDTESDTTGGTAICGAYLNLELDNIGGTCAHSTTPKSPTVYSESACTGNCDGANPCVWKNGKPTRDILHASLGVGGLVSKNFVYIKESEKNLDHSIVLKGLEANNIYHIYCHMDNIATDISDVLKVWTGESDLLTDVSFISSDTTMGAVAMKTTLTFTHGKALSASDLPIINPFRYTALFNNLYIFIFF